MFGLMLKSTHIAVVRDMTADLRAETRRANENGADVVNLQLEVNRLSDQLARWKPDRDAKGHFIKAGAEAQKVRA